MLKDIYQSVSHGIAYSFDYAGSAFMIGLGSVYTTVNLGLGIVSILVGIVWGGYRVWATHNDQKRAKEIHEKTLQNIELQNELLKKEHESK